MSSIYLLLSLLVCHYLADYCLTFPSLIRAKADGRRLLPILQHACVHGSLMGVCLFISGVEMGDVLWLVGFEVATHFVIDVSKTVASLHFPILADRGRKPYWMAYGLDQLLHQVVVVMIWMWAG